MKYKVIPKSIKGTKNRALMRQEAQIDTELILLIKDPITRKEYFKLSEALMNNAKHDWTIDHNETNDEISVTVRIKE